MNNRGNFVRRSARLNPGAALAGHNFHCQTKADGLPTSIEVLNALRQSYRDGISISALKSEISKVVKCEMEVLDKPHLAEYINEQLELLKKKSKTKKRRKSLSPIALAKNIMAIQQNVDVTLQKKRKAEFIVQAPQKRAKVVVQRTRTRVVNKYFSVNGPSLIKMSYDQNKVKAHAPWQEKDFEKSSQYLEEEPFHFCAVTVGQEIDEELKAFSKSPPLTQMEGNMLALSPSCSKLSLDCIEATVISELALPKKERRGTDQSESLTSGKDVADEFDLNSQKGPIEDDLDDLAGFLVFDDPAPLIDVNTDEKDESESSSQSETKTQIPISEDQAVIIQVDCPPTLSQPAKNKSPLNLESKLQPCTNSIDASHTPRKMTPTRDGANLTVPFGSLNPRASPIIYSPPTKKAIIPEPITPTANTKPSIKTPSTARKALKSAISKKKKQEPTGERTPRRVNFHIPINAPKGGGKYRRQKEQRRKQPRPLSDQQVEERVRKGQEKRQKRKEIKESNARRRNARRFDSPSYKSSNAGIGRRRPLKKFKRSPKTDLLQFRGKQKVMANRAKEEAMLKNFQPVGDFVLGERKEAERAYSRRGANLVSRVQLLRAAS